MHNPEKKDTPLKKSPGKEKDKEEMQKDKEKKSPNNMDVQEGNIKHDPSDPHGLTTEIEKHDRQKK